MKLRRVAVAVLAMPSCVIAYEVPSGTNSTTEATDTTGSTGGGTSTSSGSDSTPTDTDLGCVEDQMQCTSGCADVQVDPDHCGECGIVCGPTEACDRAECRDSCRDDRQICERYCVDLDVDPIHCGGCNMPCGADEVCVDRMCQTGSET